MTGGSDSTAVPNAIASTEDFEFAALALAHNYRRLILERFGSALRGRVLEVGAGVGQFTEALCRLPSVQAVLSVEPDAGFCRRLRERLPDQPVIEGTTADVPATPSWDATFCVNVLEHIEDDGGELARQRERLRPGAGRLCLLVPARPELFSPIDRDFGHWRRYTRRTLRARVEEAGFVIDELAYFNLVGYFAWLVNFRLLRRRTFDARGVHLFDRWILPVANAVEQRLPGPPVGQSLICIARA